MYNIFQVKIIFFSTNTNNIQIKIKGYKDVSDDIKYGGRVLRRIFDGKRINIQINGDFTLPTYKETTLNTWNDSYIPDTNVTTVLWNDTNIRLTMLQTGQLIIYNNTNNTNYTLAMQLNYPIYGY